MAKKILDVPPQFQERFDELVRIETELYDLKREQEIKTASLWRDIEVHFDARGAMLKYVKSKNQIEMTQLDGEEEDAEMLKKIRAGKAIPAAQHPAQLRPTAMGSALPKVVFAQKPGLWQRLKNSFRKND